jgi:hypothetical protein
MPNSLQIFHFNSNAVRVEVDEQGNPWFVAKDICNILGYANHNEAVKYHCKAEGVAKCYPIYDQYGRQQFPVFINEGNLYRLVIKSNKPEAEPFESWVCDEVLPAIRKHGHYGKPASPFDDILPELPPIMRVNSALLAEFRRMSPSLAKVYILECGVTPEYINQQLNRLGEQSFLGISHANAAPFEILQQEIPLQAEQQDERYFYLRRPAFERLCGDFNVTDTARMLRDRNLLKYNPNSLTCRAPRHMFNGKRVLVFAIKKSIVD